MAYSLYDGTIHMAKGALVSLRNLVNQASQQPQSSTPGPDALLTARLADDMWPFAFQVQYTCNQALSIASRLSPSTNDNTDDLEPAMPSTDGPMTYEPLLARIEEAIAALNATERETVNRLGEEKVLVSKYRGREMEVPVKTTVGLVQMPNVYFHVAMAYAILRANGVELEKRNWSRGFVREFVSPGLSQ